MPGAHASASNALATFTDPPSPVQYRSVTSPVAHKTSSTSSSCRRNNAGAGIGGKRSTEVEKSGSNGMAAAVLSPGGFFFNKNKK